MSDSIDTDWTSTTLGDVVHLQRGHDLPARARVPGSVPVVGSGDADGWHNQAMANGPGVVIGRATNLGRPKFVREDYWPLNTTLYVKDFKGNTPRWVYYLFKTLDLTGYDSGSVQPMLNRNNVQRVPVLRPPLVEQRAIAEVLGSLDDKIEANRKLSNLATSFAFALGTSILASEDGPTVSIEQVADICKGVSYKSEELIPGEGWLVSLKCFGRDGLFQPDGYKPFAGNAKETQIVQDGDVIVAQTDVTQRAEVIGRAVRVERGDHRGRLVASLDCIVVRPRAPFTREVLLAILSQQSFRDHALAYCNGTTVLHMNSRAVPAYEFPRPSDEVIGKASILMAPLLERAAVARIESIKLADLRDTLLPKLISGELRVRGVEHLVEDAV